MLLFKKRFETNNYIKYLILFLSILFSFIIGGILFLLNGINPFFALSSMFIAVFGSFYGFTETLLYSIPIAFCAMGIALAANMKIWNIGAEGQFVMGAFGASLIALNFNNLPPILVIILMILSALFFSSLLGCIAGFLKAMFNVNEILITLMLNYISILFVSFLIYGPWKGKDNFPYTAYFPDFTFIPTLFSSRLHIGIFVAIIIAIIFTIILKKSIWGYQIRVIGESIKAALYAGIPVKRNIIIILSISAGLAGLGGLLEIAGLQHRLQPSITQGYGFTGIIVAWLAKNNMIIITIVSFFIAALFTAGDELQMFYKIPSSIVKVFQGIILFCILGSDIFINNKLVWEKKNV